MSQLFSPTFFSNGAQAVMCKTGMQVINHNKKERFLLNISQYAGSHPFSVTNNQGLEGTHAQYKKDHTFRSEVALEEFAQVTENLVSFSLFNTTLSFCFVISPYESLHGQLR